MNSTLVLGSLVGVSCLAAVMTTRPSVYIYRSHSGYCTGVNTIPRTSLDNSGKRTPGPVLSNDRRV